MTTAARTAGSLAALCFLVATSSSFAQSDQHQNVPYCKLESETSRKLEAPPQNAAALREVAKRHHPRGFGPPPSQTDLPGSTWDLTNEFWYKDDSGELVLYCNTNDNYMYHWRFRASGGKVRLVGHGLLECSGG